MKDIVERLIPPDETVEMNDLNTEVFLAFHRGENGYPINLGGAPDEPAMWLAAMKYINGEKQ